MPSSRLLLNPPRCETVVQSTHVSHDKEVFLNGTVFPFDTFTFSPRLSYNPLDGTYVKVPPLCHAVLTGSEEDVRAILTNSKRTEQFQRDLDYALFFANRSKDTIKANLLFFSGANPGRPFSFNGLHGAASQGLLDEIGFYASRRGASVDVQDETLLTPIIYAMDLDSPHDWYTIKYLFMLGASPEAKVHDSGYTYAQIARERGKEELAQKLEAYKGWVGPFCKKSVVCVKWDKYTAMPWVGVRYTHPEFPKEYWDHTSYELFSELDDDLLRKEAKRMWEEKRSRRRLRRSIRKEVVQ